MIVLSGVHVAPRAPSSRVASVIGGPPVIATFLSLTTPSSEPTHRPSGETNGPRRAPPTARRASREPLRRALPLWRRPAAAAANRRFGVQDSRFPVRRPPATSAPRRSPAGRPPHRGGGASDPSPGSGATAGEWRPGCPHG